MERIFRPWENMGLGVAPGLLWPSAMRLRVEWNNEKSDLDLADGLVKVGGAPNDDICVLGLPHGLVTLEVAGERLTANSVRSIRIGSTLFPPRVPRLVMPGESVVLPNEVKITRPNTVEPEQRKSVGTAFVADQLINGDVVLENTRAASLVCVTGNDAGARFGIAFANCVIGRSMQAEIRIKDRAVSRTHARLYREGRAYLIAPVEGTNGVYVNGSRIKGSRELKDGDVIEVGQTMLRFEAGQRAPVEETVLMAPKPELVEPPAEVPALNLERPQRSVVVQVDDDSELTGPTLRREDPRRGSLRWLALAVGATLLALMSAGITTWLLLRRS